jgi:pyruvate/2-oxoglutarate dehydrogenase complex dihydrolipoamide dehydrogenase (E3) component/uncharacterized membrane protein YdjX (TVP38/TMEM64 family)
LHDIQEIRGWEANAMKAGKVLTILILIGLIAAYFIFDLGRYLTLDYFKSQLSVISEQFATNPVRTVAIYMAIYIVAAPFGLATVLTLGAGAVFGLLWGTIIVSFASTLAATFAFLVSRFLLRDAVQSKFGDALKTINEGVEKEGGFYLFTMRLFPGFPFFVINLVMGLTRMKTWTFFWVSQIGMLLGTIVYVNAGTELGKLTSLKGILSPPLILSFVLLAVFPLIAKKIVDTIKARKVYAKWEKPKHFDRNIVAIGAGSAGLVTSYIAAAVKAKVTLVEKHQMGGDCLNTGCVPSKALIRSAKLLSHIKRAKEFGIKSASADFDFADVMERVQRVVSEIEPHDSVERYTALGVECLKGTAKITSPWTVDITKEDGSKVTLTTKNIVIAAGARPFVPPIPGLAEINPLTSDTVWNLRVLPKRLVVLGGGPIGSELTQCFARFGSKVTQVEMLPRIIAREDSEFSDLVRRRFEEEGVDVLVNHKAKQVLVENGEKILVVEHEGNEKRIAFDELLCAVGRVPNTTGYGLEELGIPTTKSKTVEVNDYMETLYPNIFACGDVAGPYQFTHTASHGAWYASVNALFGRFKKFKVDYSVVPWATFTDPEVARVGINEQEAIEKKIPHDVFTYGIDDLDRAIADSEAHGYVKVITAKGTDKILGATIAGEHAGDILIEFITAMKYGLGLNKIMGTIHSYPTMGEANKYAAGLWKRSTATKGKLGFAEAFHDWTRGAGGLGSVLAKIPAFFRDKRPAYSSDQH